MQNGDTAIERKDTGMRLLFTILFLLIAEVIRIILGLVTLFSLVFALITKHPPGERVRLFANRTISYLYHIWRYLTYNAPEPPFPFADFPAEVEPLTDMSKQGRTESEGAQGKTQIEKEPREPVSSKSE
jgi:hypothetical protein